MNITKYVKLWLALGEDDMRSAQILLEDGGSPNSICFHCQQAGEKYLKGFLTASEKKLRKVHDLKDLLELCVKLDAEFSKLERDAVYLNRFYIETRYADDYHAFSPDEAKGAIATVLHVKNFVMNKLKEKAL